MTTSNVSLNIRMDKDLKNNLSNLCDELGMNVSTAFTIFAKAMVRRGGIPFDVALDESPLSIQMKYFPLHNLKRI